jgi:hypothetical protein
MQDRYVGDVGDFAKYAILRSVGRGSNRALRLAVVWYLYPDEGHNSDGRHISYLTSEVYRALDPQLHTSMNHLVRSAKRHVAEVRKAAVLPPETVFFEDSIVGECGSGTIGRRRAAFRSEWFIRAKEAVAGTDIVFLDPDNGIEVRSVPKHAPKAGKYVFWDEIEALWARGQSLVIYHHSNRTMTVGMQTQALTERFADRLSRPPFVRSLLFRRGSCRHFWVIGQRAHAARLSSCIETMLSSGWSAHFDVG